MAAAREAAARRKVLLASLALLLLLLLRLLVAAYPAAHALSPKACAMKRLARCPRRPRRCHHMRLLRRRRELERRCVSHQQALRG